MTDEPIAVVPAGRVTDLSVATVTDPEGVVRVAIRVAAFVVILSPSDAHEFAAMLRAEAALAETLRRERLQ